LGIGSTTQQTSPQLVDSATTWTAIATGSPQAVHSLAIKEGKLFTWGAAAAGILGNGTTTPNVTSPAQIGSDTDWRAVAAGDTFSVALKG
jgi:alpha-tubulin suppressor-like RCC1 family protein